MDDRSTEMQGSDAPIGLTIVERTSEVVTCECCGGDRQRIVGYLNYDGSAYAVYYASCYPDHGEAWIDVILGTWGTGDPSDHVTFGCRYGRIDGYADPACSLVEAAQLMGDSPMFGRRLDREAALEHSWLPAFWEVVDHVLVADPGVRNLASSIAE